MLKKSFALFLAFSLFMQFACAKRYQLPRLESTDGYVQRRIEVQTHQGQKYRLLIYQITENKIIGKDEEGKEHEELLANITSVTVISKYDAEEHLIGIISIGFVCIMLLAIALAWSGTDLSPVPGN